MDKLLDLLKSLFKDADSVQRLLGKLAEVLLRDVVDPRKCKDEVIRLLQSGTLDEEFAKDPVHVMVCLLSTALAVATKLNGGHDHGGPVFGDGPDENFSDLAAAFGIAVPVGNGEAGGPLSSLFLELMLSKLLELLSEKLNDWLKK